MLDWFDRLHPAVKVMFVLAGGLLSATSSRLPEYLQDFGLWLGITILVVALGGLALHAIRDFRGGKKVVGVDLILLGLGGMSVFALIALVGVIWHTKTPIGKTGQPPKTAVSQAGATTAPPPLLPPQYKTAGHRERLGEIFYELKTMIDRDIRPLPVAAHQIIVGWEDKKTRSEDPNDFVRAMLPGLWAIGDKAEKAEVEIYSALYKKHSAYSDLLNEITLRDRSVQREWPIVRFAAESRAFHRALSAHRNITANNSLHRDDMVALINRVQHDFQDAVHKLNGWADDAAQRVKKMEQELGG